MPRKCNVQSLNKLVTKVGDADTLVDTMSYRNQVKSNITNQETHIPRARKQTLTKVKFPH